MRRDSAVHMIKTLVYNIPLLRGLLIAWYKLRGQKPWSIGYSTYKYTFIRDIISHRLDIFRRDRLPPGYGFGMDERTVEYPWFFAKLKDDAVYLLDAGSTLNQRDVLSVKKLKNRKLYITTLSYEGIPRLEGIPSYIYEDLRKMCYQSDFFDAIVCISTLEHVGMDNTFLYTNDMNKKENSKYAFLSAIKELRRVLKAGGSLYVTVPYGKYQNRQWFQIFDGGMVAKLKEGFSPAHCDETYFRYADGQWNYSDARSCQDAGFFDIHREKTLRNDYLAAAESVACLELVK